MNWDKQYRTSSIHSCNTKLICSGFRSVHYAACGGNVEILKILQNKLYDMRSVTSQGYSALHFAVKYSHEPAVRWLIEEVELDAALPPGRGVASVLALARRKRNANIISCLEEVSCQFCRISFFLSPFFYSFFFFLFTPLLKNFMIQYVMLNIMVKQSGWYPIFYPNLIRY